MYGSAPSLFAVMGTLGTIFLGRIGWRVYRVRKCRFDRCKAVHERYAHLVNDLDEMTYAEAGEIIKLTSYWDFPFSATVSLSLVLLKSYGIPSTSKVLWKSGELSSATAGKRAEDTALLISEVFAQGLDSEAGSTALARINYLHSRYGKLITQDDLLYNVALHILEPIEFIRNYEWRQLTPLEVHARYVYWREIGARMGVKDIPRTLEELKQWSEDYAERAVAYAPENTAMAEDGLKVIGDSLPDFAKPLCKQTAAVFIDARLREAFGWNRAPPTVPSWLLPALLRFRRLVVGYLHFPRTEPVPYRQTIQVGDKYVRKGFFFEPWYVQEGGTTIGAAGFGTPGGKQWQSDGFQHCSLGPAGLASTGIDKTLKDAASMRERAAVCPFFM